MKFNLLKNVHCVIVIPAKAGIQQLLLQIYMWIPAFAGMTAGLFSKIEI